MTTYVAVVGPGDDAAAADCADAREVGRLLAAAGVVVGTGGLGGVLAAAAAGAASAGGVSVGLLPGDDRSAAAASLTVALPTGLGELRNALVVRAADAVVAIGGSWGTLSEVALAARAGTPVVAIRGWTLMDGGGVDRSVEAMWTPREAVDRVLAVAGSAPEHPTSG